MLLKTAVAGDALGPGRSLPPSDVIGGRGASKPHICFVAPTAWPLFSGDREIPVVGGAELQQSFMAPALVQRGYKVSMITLDYGQADRTVVKGVTVHKLYKPDEGIPVVRFVYPRLTRTWQVLKEVNADVYYQRTAAALTGFVAAFCKRHGKRSIYNGASDVDFLPGKQDITFARDKWLFEFGLRHVDRIFVQNLRQQEWLAQNYGRGDGVLVPNCYHAPADAKADPNGYVLWVATVRAQKRPELLLEMARRLPQYKFVVVGGYDIGWNGEEYERNIRQQAARLPNVEYRGFLPYVDADRVFSGARVLLNTSMYEGFPNTFLQAWARGVPTVAFVDIRSRDADGKPVYDIAGDIDQATGMVQRLMDEDAYWAQASTRVAAQYRAHHSMEAVVDLFERQVGELLSR
jgi:glycosyltransferase involved in cell wall biosynthesis